MFAYNGKILHIDLNNKKSSIEFVEQGFLRDYLGGIGMAVKLLYDNTKAGIDPLGTENVLTFATSALVNTIAPASSKHGAAAKSPLTGFIGDSISSSYWSQSLRKAGYDALVIKGKSELPIYLFIDNESIFFKDAEHLMEKGCFETEEMIRSELGDDRIRVSSIGIAGEKMVHFACIGNDRGRQLGRCGLGAVMGSKNLKAIALRGSNPTTVANIKELENICLELIRISQGAPTEKYRVLGTVSNVLVLNRLGVLPTRNYRDSMFEGAEEVSGEYIHKYHKEKTVACHGCPIGCEQVISVKDGPYKGSIVGLDFESLYGLGICCGIKYMPAIIHMASFCDYYGLDTISTGVVIAWAMECFENGILKKSDLDGLELYFGNYNAAISIIKKIALREGIGELLGEGVKRASGSINNGSEHFAMHVKGLEMPGYDPRGLKTHALGLAVGTRGGCHNRSFAYEIDFRAGIDRLQGGRGRGKLAKDQEDFAAVLDSISICKFMRGCFKDFYSQASKIYSLVTGLDMSAEELKITGERVCNLKKAFNIREGWNMEDDWLPPRILKDPIPSGASEGSFVMPDELRAMISDYYDARCWTEQGLIPYEVLLKLGLKDISPPVAKQK